MRIGLIDVDGHSGFPNLALMKLAAWHKSKGDSVEWYSPMFSGHMDRVYMSKVFTFTDDFEYYIDADEIVKGGTGYKDYATVLPDKIESTFPDYSLYPKTDYAIGFLTRGCIRNCKWCIVPKKEGYIKPYRTWQQIVRPDSNRIVFMDNNVLAHQHGLEQMEELTKTNIMIDFNQGLDGRLVTREIADLISRLKWIKFIRMAADTDQMLYTVLDKIELLKDYGVKPYRLFIYVLVQDIESAERRCIALRDAGANPFAQPYRDFTNNIEPSKQMKAFARWVNNKAVFKSTRTFAEYSTTIRGHNSERKEEE